jgi:glucose-6-phosphate 1-dehydrogenase
LPPQLTVVGMARRAKTDDEYRAEVGDALRKHSRQTVRDELWDSFAKSIFYHTSDFGDAEGYKKLGERLNALDQERGTGGNRLFYLAAAPDQFEPILKHLEAAGLNNAPDGGWARIIVEKPLAPISRRRGS